MKYIITDPCYLLTYEEQERYNKLKYKDALKKSNDLLSEILGTDVYSEQTGFGAWNNMMFSKNPENSNRIIFDTFSSDSNTVCVCELTDSILERYNKYVNKEKAAVIELDNKPKVHFDTSDPKWTVVIIEDNDKEYYSFDFKRVMHIVNK